MVCNILFAAIPTWTGGEVLFTVVCVLVIWILICAVASVANEDEINKIKDVVRWHRDLKGHDRCWTNNLNLYAKALPGEELPEHIIPQAEFEQGCKAYQQELYGSNSPNNVL